MFLFLLSLWIPVLILTATASEYRTQYCGLNVTRGQTNNTTYFKNLDKVLDSLASDTAVNNCKFNKKTNGSHPDIAYGLYLCREGILPNDCRNCLLKARDNINKSCPFSKEAVLWKDNCMLRYSNHPMDSMNSNNFKYACNGYNFSQNTSEQTRFWGTARSWMDQLASLASNHSKKVAYNELSYSNKGKVYGYVQCIPYLSASDCNRCLRESINRLRQYCYSTRGARVLTPSCNVRFEAYEFVQGSAASSHDLSGLTSNLCFLK